MKKLVFFAMFFTLSLALKAETQIENSLAQTKGKGLNVESCTVYASMQSPCTGNVITIHYTSNGDCESAYNEIIRRIEEIEDLAEDAGC